MTPEQVAARVRLLDERQYVAVVSYAIGYLQNRDPEAVNVALAAGIADLDGKS